MEFEHTLLLLKPPLLLIKSNFEYKWAKEDKICLIVHTVFRGEPPHQDTKVHYYHRN
jgi:hypothetical protein